MAEEEGKKHKRNKSKETLSPEEPLTLESLAARVASLETTNSKLHKKVKNLESQNEFFLRLFSHKYHYSHTSNVLK